MTSMDRTGPRRRWRIAALAALIAAAGLVLALPQILTRTIAPDSHGPRRANPGSQLAGSRGRLPLLDWPHADRRGGPSRRARGPARRRRPGRLPLEPLADPRPSARNRRSSSCREPSWTSSGWPTAGSTCTRRSGRSSRRSPSTGSSSRSRADGCDSATRRSVEPIVADETDLHLVIPPKSQPVEWNLELARHAGDGQDPGRVTFKGSVHRPGTGGATIALDVSRWPWAGRDRGGGGAR